MLSTENRKAALILRDDFKMGSAGIVSHFAGNGVMISTRDLISLFPPGNTPKLRLKFAGMDLSVSEWAKRTGIPVFSIWKRYKLAWPVERILTEPVRKQRNNIRCPL